MDNGYKQLLLAECESVEDPGKPWATSIRRRIFVMGSVVALAGSSAYLCSTSSVSETSRNASSLYVPELHAKQADNAFQKYYSQEGQSTEYAGLVNHVNIFPKITAGTCAWVRCRESRGPVDCLQGQCICRGGYVVTADGSACIPVNYAVPWKPQALTTNTGGSCSVKGCHASRGPTQCVGSLFSKSCICVADYFVDEGKCLPQGMMYANKFKEEFLPNLKAGVVEPDAIPCPGSGLEMGSEGVEGSIFKREIYAMSTCRRGIQMYHGSPFPLVHRTDLVDNPSENGNHEPNNDLKDMYSLSTNRQWRSTIIRVISYQYMLALVRPDILEAAQRLGNAFHTLSDTFSGSHVDRDHSPFGRYLLTGEATMELCSKLLVTTPLSMDVVDWPMHVVADKLEDMLSYCASTFELQGIKLWFGDRLTGVSTGPFTSAERVNEAVGRFVTKVLCPAIQVRDLDAPSGGSPSRFSVGAIGPYGSDPEFPRGVASEKDAEIIIAKWAEELKEYREGRNADQQRQVPDGLFLAPRDVDICKSPTAFRFTEEQVQTAIQQIAVKPDYLIPVANLRMASVDEA